MDFDDEADYGGDTTDNQPTNWAHVTHNEKGSDLWTIDGQGSDSFGATTNDASTGTSTTDNGSESFAVDQLYSDRYSDGSTYDLDGDLDVINTTHTDVGVVTLSTGLQGSDTFAMQATDPATGDTSWDNGGEVYSQGQSVSATFNDNAWSNSTPRYPSDGGSARPTTAAAPTRSPRATRLRTTTDGARPTRRRGTSTPAPGRRTTG